LRSTASPIPPEAPSAKDGSGTHIPQTGHWHVKNKIAEKRSFACVVTDSPGAQGRARVPCRAARRWSSDHRAGRRTCA
jgi:hypothetical protein